MKVKIIKPGINGEGIGYIDRTPVFIPGALKDEEVDIRIEEKKPRFAIGRLNRVLTKSSSRVQPRCKIQRECGACTMMIAQYDMQLAYKSEILRQSLIKYAQINPKYIEAILPSDLKYAYRNQCKVPFHMEEGSLTTGMYVPGSNYFYEIKKCIILDEGIEKIRKEVVKITNRYGCNAYDYHKKTGMRSLIIRGFNGIYQCTLVTGEDELEPLMVEEIMAIEGINSLWQSIHTIKKAPDVFGAKMILLSGRRYLPFKLNEMSLAISPRSSFRLHTAQTKVLYNKVSELITNQKDLIVDAYAGIGAMSLSLKDKAKEIIGIDHLKDAVITANQNAKDNNALNVSFICADAADKLEYISKKRVIDILLLDPPRTGLDDAMLSCILKSKISTIIYVSCNPATLGKDLSILNDRYRVKKIIPLDMFPQTAEVESITLLQRK